MIECGVMKKIGFIALCVLLFIISFALVITFRVLQIKSEVAPTPTPVTQTTPTPIDFELAPPKQSLQGRVTRLTGTVMKTVRDEKDPQETNSKSVFLEGEQLTASPSASIDIQFSEKNLFSVSPETILAFPSTNPKNFLFKIDKGTVVFETDEMIATISARSLHGLFSLSQGKASISVDPDKKIITYMIAEGSGQLGYIDSDNKTQTVDITEGQTATFNDEKRTVKIQ